MKNARAHLAAPVTDSVSAKAWLDALVRNGMSFYLGNDPSDIPVNEAGKQ
jgi:hypothetical protein